MHAHYRHIRRCAPLSAIAVAISLFSPLTHADLVFPRHIIGYSNLISGFISLTGDAACVAVTPPPAWGYQYSNGRYEDIPPWGPGCNYTSLYVATGAISNNNYKQNWARPELGCSTGYDTYFDFPANTYLCRLREDQPPAAYKPCAEPGSPDPTTGNVNYVIEALPGTSTGPAIQYNASSKTWRSPISTRLERTPTTSTARVHLPDGTRAIFTLNGDIATGYAAGTGVLRKTGDQWVYESPLNDQFTFDSSGQVIQWRTRGGKDIFDFTRSTGLVSITSNKGIIVKYGVNSTGQPTSVTSGSNSYAMSYDARGKLEKITLSTDASQKSKTFFYEIASQPNSLTGVKDENNVRLFTWAYDNNGRVTSLSRAGTVMTTNSYNTDGTTTTTNGYEKSTKYKFSVIRNAKYVSAIEGQPSANCPSSNSSFTYDAKGLMKTKTDAKGNVTSYDYNDRGLETSRTEASGTPQARTITTEWHPTLFLKTKVTEPNRITTYQYDAQGRQTGQTVTPR